MANTVRRSLDQDAADLIGVDRFPSPGDRFDLEVAKLLLSRGVLSLTGLATAMRQRAERASSLAQAIIATGLPQADYYRAVADCYGLRYVDLEREPVDAALTTVNDRADYADRLMVPWQSRDGRLLIATTAISRENVEWADARFGETGYDFVITVPFDIRW
jgi:hypothetical protein